MGCGMLFQKTGEIKTTKPEQSSGPAGYENLNLPQVKNA